jgi:hypothetical protein
MVLYVSEPLVRLCLNMEKIFGIYVPLVSVYTEEMSCACVIGLSLNMEKSRLCASQSECGGNVWTLCLNIYSIFRPMAQGQDVLLHQSETSGTGTAQVFHIQTGTNGTRTRCLLPIFRLRPMNGTGTRRLLNIQTGTMQSQRYVCSIFRLRPCNGTGTTHLLHN